MKNNNARLTSALQESTANVEEWKRQLHSYKEENTRLKVGLIELEAGRGIIDYSIYFILQNGVAYKDFSVYYLFMPNFLISD